MLHSAQHTVHTVHSVRLRRNLLCGGVAACPSMACVLCVLINNVSLSVYKVFVDKHRIYFAIINSLDVMRLPKNGLIKAVQLTVL